MHTEHSWMSEEELICKVVNGANATSMETELANRLEEAMDWIDTLEEALAANGIELSVVPLQ